MIFNLVIFIFYKGFFCIVKKTKKTVKTSTAHNINSGSRMVV